MESGQVTDERKTYDLAELARESEDFDDFKTKALRVLPEMLHVSFCAHALDFYVEWKYPNE